MKIIFFGTPDYVIPVLEAIHKEYDDNFEQSLMAVVTQPPRPTGRKHFVTYSAVDDWAHKRKGIEIIRDLKSKEFPEADLGIVAAYGKIIPDDIIKKFKFGILNIHPSLLPKYRGASPIQGALLNGETETGVSIIKMDEKMDHGPIVSSFKEPILSDDTNETLRKRLFERSAEFLINLIPNYIGGKIKLKQQDHEKATFTKIVERMDGFVNMNDEKAAEIYRKFRAYTPWPGIWTNVQLSNVDKESKRVKILKAHMEDEKLVIDEVQLEGKNAVSFEEFRLGYPDFKF